MLITEEYTSRKTGKQFVRNYSDAGYWIERDDGELFVEAVDLKEEERAYSETDKLIDEDYEDEPF